MSTPLSPEQLYRCCPIESLPFETTADLEDLHEILGQDRALSAIRFGIGIRREGYNLFVLGPHGTGKRTLIRQLLEERAGDQAAPDDWCYVYNFEQPHKPRALRLPTGWGGRLKADMGQLVEDLRSAIPAAFEGEEYRKHVTELEEEFKHRREDSLNALGQEAEARNITLLRTPTGFAFAPTRNGETIKPADYEKLPEGERQAYEQAIEALQEKLKTLLNQLPRWQKESRERLKKLNREVTLYAIGHLMEEVKAAYRDMPMVLGYLAAVEQDLVDTADDFRRGEEEQPAIPGLDREGNRVFRRYEVNVLVEHASNSGAPVVIEDNPSFQNLVGRAEHVAQMGTLVTDFTLLKPGALHKANGGYLVLDVHKVLTAPYAWEGLKRALSTGRVRIESLGEVFSLVSTVSLDPEPIPLDVKLVLAGERMLYYLLQYYDPDFAELFKVAADFDEVIDQHDDAHQNYARLLATLVRKEELLHLDRGAVARVIEHSARLAGDTGKLSTHMRSIADLLREADYWAREAGRQVMTREDIQHTIDTQIYRLDRIREKVQEAIANGLILIDTQGEQVGQVNALSVIQLGEFSFGQPSRVTATTHLGDGKVIDIEREVELGGALHSKGVLILSNFVTGRYAANQPVSFSASLTFEQSYGIVEGDSASLAELCALLSALSGTSIRQSLAMTGSVNQLGQVQAIGGVNEKIEGFYDVCHAHGLSGDQGVLIPASNLRHLMLRQDIVDAVAAGRFRIYPVTHVDQALELLTGRPSGEPNEDGVYPENTINGRVQLRLAELTAIAQAFSSMTRPGDEEDSGPGEPPSPKPNPDNPPKRTPRG